MRRTILSISLVVAVFAFVLQLPIDNIAKNVQGQVFQNMAALTNFTLKGNTAVGTALATSAERWKLDPKMMYAICMIESGCGRNTLSKTSSARGIYQYIRSTWSSSCGAYRARVDSSASCDVHNAQMSVEVFAFDRKRREKIVNSIAQSSGLPVGVVNYIDHFSPGMAQKLPNKALYNRSFASIMGNAAARANNMQGKTFGQVVAFFQNKYARYAGTAPANLADLQTGQDENATVKSIGQKWWDSLTGKSVAKPQSQQQSAQKATTPTSQNSRQNAQTQKSSSWLDDLLGKNTATNPLTAAQPKAELTCDEVGGKVQLRWSCPTGTTVSRGFGTLDATFDTHGAGAGIVSVQPVFGAEYILQCLKGHQLHAEAKCVVPVFETVDTVDSLNSGSTGRVQDSIPSGVTMEIEHQDDVILWKTSGTTSCRLSSGDRSATGTTGGVRIGALTEDMLVKLECESTSGPAVKYKNIEI
jgi:hypothetical protein